MTEEKTSFRVFFTLQESFIYIFLLSLRQNINESSYILTCKSRCRQPEREIELGQLDLFKNCSSSIKLSITLNCYHWFYREKPLLWMSSEVTALSQDISYFFYTYISPHIWSSSNHWQCLIVNISYVCLLAASVSVVQGEASLSWCIRSHKVNKTLACVSSQSALRMQSCVAFWLRQAIKKKR